ncbi:protein LYK5-like isoform X1 [Arachis stenosperma]|uniref:protein LYK5-like isoform X1 n=1 Tax=Arachis stenosperma TaxID=217475 RepID=UPI0025ACCCC4|nr:protein LYK5-like isoform X1 [Arachis stenosperma]
MFSLNFSSMKHLVYLIIFLSLRLCSAQQNYSGNSILRCNNDDKKGPSPSFLYTCNNNGIKKSSSCMAFLIFKSQPPYNTITTISNLTSSNPIDLARINDVTTSHTMFQIGKEVIVPLKCSCSSMKDTKYYYYQSKTKHVLGAMLPETTYFNVANETFQGLTTCDSLKRFNPYPELDLRAGMELNVPLRCACPTWNQERNGTKYLMTYSVNWGDTISSIASRFNATVHNLLEANGISMETTIFPFTTLLIPLPSEPLSSSTIIVANDPPYDSTSPHAKTGSKGIELKKLVIINIVLAAISILSIMLSLVFFIGNISERFIKAGEIHNKNHAISEDIRVEMASIDVNYSKLYKFEEIKDATENFSSRNRIKGSVFHGEFGNKRESFAVKRRISKGYASKEINLLRRINHFNLIKLQGYCENEDLFYLVFEFMESGSLREWLRSEENSFLHKSWSKRIQIALDIANGLQYLHNFTYPCYVHNDINTGNILLNKDLRAKIANFSLAEELLEKRMIKSSSSSHTSDDVYAFGVVLLELITGKECVTLHGLSREGIIMVSRIMMNNLIGKEHEEEEKLSLFFDPRLIGNIERRSALMLIKLSLACLNQESESRPNMSEVVSTLWKTLSESHNNCWSEKIVMLKC